MQSKTPEELSIACAAANLAASKRMGEKRNAALRGEFGWTVVRSRVQHNTTKDYFVYRRDHPADAKHFAADLAPFTHATKQKAIAAGERGEFAYR